MPAPEAIQPDRLSARSPDKAWEEALTLFFEDFFKLLFPHIHGEIELQSERNDAVRVAP